MSDLLDSVKLPDGIKDLDLPSLNVLCKEVRDYIIITVLRSGGHLASSLGVVELTTALLYVFDAKKDRILFDVGHQCYAYKILTDRKDRFSTLRQHGGISGFPRPSESEYDKLVAGHAGTALAEAIGYSIADKLSGEIHNNVSILGDGVFANGLTLEALNNVGEFGKQIIVLNDNEYSIDKTVGGYGKYFEKIRRKPFSGRIEYDVFPTLGVGYVGLVDGHDLSALIEAFNLAKGCERSVIVHVLTVKGKGYLPAEQSPVQNHSVGVDNGFSSYEGESLLKLAEKDEKVVVIVSAMGDGNGLSEFARRFPDRFIDVGIAEGLAVSVACSLARSGFKPVVCIYSTFIQRAFDQILVEAKDLPIIYVLGRSGVVGGDGETHQGIYAYQTFAPASGVKIAYPSGVEEFDSILNWSVKNSISTAIAIPKEDFCFSSSDFDYPNWETVKTTDNPRAAIFAVGAESVKNSLYVAEMLEYADCEIDVVSVRFPSVIDQKYIGKYESVYVVDESFSSGGFAEKLAGIQSIKRVFDLKTVPTNATKEEILFEQNMSKGKIYSAIKQDLSGEIDDED